MLVWNKVFIVRMCLIVFVKRLRRLVVFVLIAVFVGIVFMIPAGFSELRHEYIVVAFDEEFANAGNLFKYVFPQSLLPLTPQAYSDWQLSRALYHFRNEFGYWLSIEVIGSLTFESEDSGDVEDTLGDALAQTSFRDGVYFGGKRATILMVWTSQNNDFTGGYCSYDDRAFIVKHQEVYADDNAILHELSHVFVESPLVADTAHGECLLSYSFKYMGFYNEPLQPDFGYVCLAVFGTQAWGYFTYFWCGQCRAEIVGSLRQGSVSSFSSGGGNRGYLLRLPALDEDFTIRFVVVLAIGVVVVVAFWLLNKYVRHRRN